MKEKIDFWRKTMQNKKVGAIAVKSIALIVMFGTPWHAIAQDAKAAYPNMAPLERYLMEDRNSENRAGAERGT
jgi:hypothetical protein